MKQPAQSWEFRSKPAWQRLLIMIGGVSVNFITAIVIYWMLLYAFGQQYIPASEAKWGYYYAPQLQELGVKDGDQVMKADTFVINSPNDIAHFIFLDDVKTLSVRRNDSTFTVNVPANFKERLLREKVKSLADFQIPFVVDSVVQGMGAANAGIPTERDRRVSGLQQPQFATSKSRNHATTQPRRTRSARRKAMSTMFPVSPARRPQEIRCRHSP